MLDHSTLADHTTFPLQLGNLMGDPMLGLWIDERRIEAFALDLLAQMDPASVRIAEAEANWLYLKHSRPLEPVSEL